MAAAGVVFVVAGDFDAGGAREEEGGGLVDADGDFADVALGDEDLGDGRGHGLERKKEGKGAKMIGKGEKMM